VRKSRTEAVVIVAEKTFCASVTRLLEDELQNQKPFGGHWSLLEEPQKKHRAPFLEKVPCKLQVIIEKTLQILGEFKACLENESVVSLWRKQHFFQSAHNPWRGFPPDGLFKKSCCIPSFILGRLECTLCIPFFGQ
jgi:hypothetical protein